MAIYNFNVTDDNLTLNGESEGNAGNANTYVGNFSFSENWDGYAKVAVFLGPDPFVVPIAQDGTCNFPSEVLAGANNFYVGVYGVDGTGKRISTNLISFDISDGALQPSTVPETPDVWETYLAEIQGYEANAYAYDSAAEQAAIDAIAAKTAAETAETNAQGYAESAEQDAGTAASAATAAVSAQASAANSAASAASSEASAISAKTAAETAAQSARNYERSAQGHADTAEAAKAETIVAKNTAVSAKNSAVSAKNDAVSAKNEAVNAKTAAQSAKNSAVSAKNDAVVAKNDAVSAKTAAQNAKTAAEAAQTAAETAEGKAKGYAESADTDAGRAESAATAAESAAATVASAISTHNADTSAHSDIRTKIGTDISTHNSSGTAHSDIRRDVIKIKASLEYYGDANIEPDRTDDYSFASDVNGGAKITAYLGYGGILHIPYECAIDGDVLKVTMIDEGAFESNTDITSAILPNTITTIGIDAFSGCTALASVKLPESLTSIGAYAFYGCTSLTSIIIPKSITSIGVNAFSESGVTNVYYTGTQAEWNSITDINDIGLGSGVTIHYDYKPSYGVDVELHNISADSHPDIRSLVALALRKIEINTWTDVQEVVRAGAAPYIFKIGDQFEVTRGNETLLFDIIGFDHDTPADSDYTHSMTLQMHNGYEGISFDTGEAAFYVDPTVYPTGLVAGTYHFYWDYAPSSSVWVRGDYQFTINESVPAGGQIFLSNISSPSTTPVTGFKASTYATAGATTPIESEIEIVSGSGGDYLGTINTSTLTKTTNIYGRMRYGSSDWKTSFIRQWLNSDGAAGTWWEAQTGFDRITASNRNKDGFLYGMDSDFLAVLGDVVKTTQKSSTDGGGLETTSEKFFLLSRPEVFNSGNDGTIYDYYKTEANRIKYRSNAARNWWLRTAQSNNYSYYVATTGDAGTGYVYNTYDAVPTCVIV